MTTASSDVITQLLADYTTFVGLGEYTNATRALSCVFNAIFDDPNADNLAIVWNFFMANISGVVKENIALAGTGSLSASDFAVYTMIYPMFRQATTGQQPVTVGNAIAVLVRAPVLIGYLEKQASAVAAGTLSGPISPVQTPPQAFSPGDLLLVQSNGTLTPVTTANLLATMMAALPTTNPGLGLPWLDNNFLVMGN
jgi:hypothetical protein